MIRITFEEAAAFAQPDGLPTREAALFWRATRLVRRAAANGGDPAALIAEATASSETEVTPAITTDLLLRSARVTTSSWARTIKTDDVTGGDGEGRSAPASATAG